MRTPGSDWRHDETSVSMTLVLAGVGEVDHEVGGVDILRDGDAHAAEVGRHAAAVAKVGDLARRHEQQRVEEREDVGARLMDRAEDRAPRVGRAQLPARGGGGSTRRGRWWARREDDGRLRHELDAHGDAARLPARDAADGAAADARVGDARQVELACSTRATRCAFAARSLPATRSISRTVRCSKSASLCSTR